MLNFLSITLAGGSPQTPQGETSNLKWQWLGEGVLMLTPHNVYTQSVVISAGIHGNETAPIEIVNQLVFDLLAGKLPLAVRLLVILGNPPAIRAGERYLAADINRMFGGRHQNASSSDETQRAAYLEQIVVNFFDADSHSTRQHFDLHTAIRGSHHTRFGLLPYQTVPYCSDMFRWLQDIELDALVMHTSAGGTFAHFSSEFCSAASCTLELGKARPFGENQLAQFKGIIAGLEALVSRRQLPARATGKILMYRVVKSLLKQHSDFKLLVADDTLNFTPFKRGTLLSEQPNDSYHVQHEMEWILFPNPRVAMGLRAGIMLVQMDEAELPLA